MPLPTLVEASMGGLKDSPGRVRDFRRLVNGGRVWCAPRLLIRASMANARTVDGRASANQGRCVGPEAHGAG